ncbi:hypothetical protein DIS15_05000 [Levilactobacillus brevis]|uniref:hypothetical protein n=1 Tax=Levilactobacillus brevis TaxID=1580 RepID=UPI0005B62CBE|nr:hypothetical protein [Levilactobacillus brevis]KIR09348.1 hypothetical protein RA16_03490 [Levilactobacillus brevis]TOY85156.1 hypothetical protein DIS15_05000 [Levilactobacillus brevis]
MKKWGALGVLIIGLVIGVAWWSRQTPRSVPVNTTSKTKPAVPKLTLREERCQPELRYVSVILYAIDHDRQRHLQRWQEVSDVDAGWQIDIYPHAGQDRYLVWPDQRITAAEKNLAPNWFTWHSGHVSYHSFIVHSFRREMVKTVSTQTLLNWANATSNRRHQVRHLVTHLTVKDHR